MGDPLDKAVSRPPPILGEGCVQRYDPDSLSDENGTDFPGAAELWRATHPPAATPVAPGPQKKKRR